MKPALYRWRRWSIKARGVCGLLLIIAHTPGAQAEDVLAVTTSSAVSFGAEGGDMFGLEEISEESVVVLLNPRGEDCTLRFHLPVGQALLIRGGPGQEPEILCEAALTSTRDGLTANFAYTCYEGVPSNDAKCAQAEEQTASPLTKGGAPELTR